MGITVNSFGAGVRLVINAGIDLSGATVTLDIIKPDGTLLSRTAPAVVLGTQTLIVDGATITANQYIEYALQSGDLSLPGVYAVRLIPVWTTPQKNLPTPTKTFIVTT